MELLLIFSTIAILISQHLLLTSSLPHRPSANRFVSCLNNHFVNPSSPISKVIFTPQNATFTSTLQAYIRNGRFNRTTTPKPVAIITATNYSHVQAAVVCSKISGLELKIRSGGHDYEGSSYVSRTPFVILDMFNLRKVQVEVESEVAWVQTGAILGEVYYNVAKKSNNTLAFPAGVCFTVGVGGHISGGGYGALMRKYGLTIDNVLDAKVVDAKGRILNREAMGEDMFWAIRGGGAASFGVILEWKLHLVRVPQTVTVFNVTNTLEEGATDIVDQWQRVAHKMDPNLFIRAQVRPTENNTVAVSFIALYLGRPQQLLTLVNATFPLLGLKSKDCFEMTWAQSTFFWLSGAHQGTSLEPMLQRSAPPNNFHKNKSDYVKKPIPKKGWEAIWKKLIEIGPHVIMQYNPYGGKMSEIAEDATPFPHRAGNLFLIQYLMYWTDTSLETEKKYVRAIRELYDTFTPYVSEKPRESFLNYKDLDIGTNAKGHLGFAHEYFKGNVERLLKVKAKVDPENVFRYEQSIPLKHY